MLEFYQLYYFWRTRYLFYWLYLLFFSFQFLWFLLLFLLSPFFYLLWFYFALHFLVFWNRSLDCWLRTFFSSTLTTSCWHCCRYIPHILICHVFIFIQFYVYIGFFWDSKAFWLGYLLHCDPLCCLAKPSFVAWVQPLPTPHTPTAASCHSVGWEVSGPVVWGRRALFLVANFE